MILVTGSGGVVGRELLRELTALGEQVRAGYHTRPPFLPQVEGVRLDVTTGDGLIAALQALGEPATSARWDAFRRATSEG